MNKIKTTTKTWTVKDEGLFVKRYNKHIGQIHGLSKTAIIVLDHLAISMRLDNVVFLVKHSKQKIADDSGLKLNTIEHAISELAEKNIIKRISQGTYKVSAKYFSKVKWKRVLAMRYSEIIRVDKTDYKMDIYESVDESKVTTDEINKILKQEVENGE